MDNGISAGVGMAAAEDKAQVHSKEDSIEPLNRGVWSLECQKSYHLPSLAVFSQPGSIPPSIYS